MVWYNPLDNPDEFFGDDYPFDDSPEEGEKLRQDMSKRDLKVGYWVSKEEAKRFLDMCEDKE